MLHTTFSKAKGKIPVRGVRVRIKELKRVSSRTYKKGWLLTSGETLLLREIGLQITVLPDNTGSVFIENGF